MNNWLNQIHQGHALEVLRQMPDKLVDCIITSPPYYGLRDYKLEPVVWDDWRGSLGLEPTIGDSIVNVELWELRDDLSDSERQLIINELRNLGAI